MRIELRNISLTWTSCVVMLKKKKKKSYFVWSLTEASEFKSSALNMKRRY